MIQMNMKYKPAKTSIYAESVTMQE